jgi:hypothetical protein
VNRSLGLCPYLIQAFNDLRQAARDRRDKLVAKALSIKQDMYYSRASRSRRHGDRLMVPVPAVG